MIVSFDGNVYAGKSSIIQLLNEHYCSSIVVPEHSDVVGEIPITKHVFAEELRYLASETYRYEDLDFEHEIIFFDRSILSQVLHCLVTSKPNSEKRSWFFGQVVELISRKKILFPDVYIFLFCQASCIRQRILKNESKMTPPLFYSEEYLNKAYGYFVRIQDFLTNRGVDVRVMDTSELSEQDTFLRVTEHLNMASEVPCSDSIMNELLSGLLYDLEV